jgi:hypothetical protein
MALPSAGEERTIVLDEAGLPTAGVVSVWELETA